MFTLRIANYQIDECYSKTLLNNPDGQSVLSVSHDKISDRNVKTCFWIESD